MFDRTKQNETPMIDYGNNTIGQTKTNWNRFVGPGLWFSGPGPIRNRIPK